MTEDELLARFAHDLKIGRGRAIQLARRHPDKAALKPIVLTACASHQAYDPQCEGTRTGYLLDAVEAVDAMTELRPLVLTGLPKAEDWDVGHFLGFVTFFASEGDEEARALLVSHAWTKELSADACCGLVEIDGEAGLVDRERGLLLAARIVGERLTQGDEWIARSVFDEAVERFGKEAVEAALADAARLDAAIIRFRETVTSMVEAWAPRPEPPPPSETFAEIWRLIEAEPPRRRRGWGKALFWARHASETELAIAAAALEREEDAARQAVLLRMFAERPFPGSLEVLLAFSRNEDELVAQQGRAALSSCSDPSLREEAWRRLGEPKPLWDILQLFARNAVVGDGARLARLLGEAGGFGEDAHHAVSSVLDGVPETVDPREWVPPLLWAYEASPCSICREHVVARLLEMDALPDDLRRECRWDARDDIRALVRKPAPPS